jgi:glycosyltransferase involved in cell wall biosynthesis
MSPVIYVDLRPLQDRAYQFRGVGQHIAALLSSRWRSTGSSWRIVGLVSEQMDDLPPTYMGLVDETTYATNPPITRYGTVFIDGSPMTHDPYFTARFSSEPRCLNAAVIYDFIPFDWPGYLPNASDRLEYLAKLKRLKSFDLYFPISEYSSWRLSEIAGVDRNKKIVTGASVRKALYEIRARRSSCCSPYKTLSPYMLLIGGGDRRKNPELAIKAMARLNAELSRPVALKLVGHYPHSSKTEFLRLAGHQEGNGFLEFCTDVDDETLVSLYSGAIATVCPSHIEGFSLPIAESAACGTPVIASTCGAHLELISNPDALFLSTDGEALYAILRRLAREPAWREDLATEQACIGSRFKEEEVGALFWNGIARAMSNRTQTRPQRRGRIALLTPYPPDESGVANFSKLTIAAAVHRLDVDFYTDAPRPLSYPMGARDAGRINSAVLFKGGYESVISVLGNSHFHTPIFEFFERFGGPCILHDTRLTHIYCHRLGVERFAALAESILGRTVSRTEIDVWLSDRDLPSLFLEPILKRAKPLIVHTRSFQAVLQERYGFTAEVATFCPLFFFNEEEIGAPSRAASRRRLGIAENAFLISTFGFVGREKGVESCIIALDLLRSWMIPAELHFVGSAGAWQGEIERIAQLFGVAASVHCMTGFVDSTTYRDYLLASDAAVQLRIYVLGHASAALADCISAGLPTVATSGLATSLDAPEYVLSVADRYSPLHVAEQLAVIWETKRDRLVQANARQEYLIVHNYDFYIKRLCEILELE